MKEWIYVTSTAQATAAEILRQAAEGFRSGKIAWGRGWFITADGCRCVLGGIAWAADPGDPDGDPTWITPDARHAAKQAVDTLAHFLIDEWGATPAGERQPDGELVLSAIETVSDWNDAEGRELADVINACTFAAALASAGAR